MPCFSPLQAYQLLDGSVVFRERGQVVRSLNLACGQCSGCRLERSRQWAVRCLHEAQCHESNSFITLTYVDSHLPANNSLRYRDFQLFMKRLRRYFNVPIRFYMCGEYGSDFSRPHYHACLFGINFPDLVYLGKTESGSLLYRSAILERLWPYGFSSVGAVTFESAAYVARYIMKKITGHHADLHYMDVDISSGETVQRVPEFNKMSLGGRNKQGGIGAPWFSKFRTDVFPHDRVVINAKVCKPPRYYDKLYARDFPIEFEATQFDREVKARLLADDATPERLAVRKQVLEAKLLPRYI